MRDSSPCEADPAGAVGHPRSLGPHPPYLAPSSIQAPSKRIGVRTCELAGPSDIELLDSAVEHDDPSKHFEVPAIKPLAVPALQQLEVPIEWAQALVPGRPVQTLRVYRNQNIAFSRNEVGPLETLKTLSATSSCIEKLAIVSLGVNFPLLSVVAEFFPHLRILGAVIPDIDAEELAPTELNPIPANAPTPSRLIQFPVPDLEDLQASLPQIHMDVEDILAKGHPTFYDEPLHK
ncbi:hypothetical protein DFP72DRAFT_498201 [Ephemerocybe angulata]|uniref:Uncharacterized protein n=1 Tax=Ephemerocybe angulata TaxID=980116 RepID=A0A8H6M2R3_9AGAR|nr:hypothetical protein DFP72DRAFT_498201 [Tulosesus angulatus]